MAITKESVILALVEAFGSIVDQNSKEDMRSANAIIAHWRALPASVVTAEAESCFGYNAICEKTGQAYSRHTTGGHKS